MDLSSSLNQYGLWGIALASFGTGLIGSVHCLTMCGAFSSQCSKNGQNHLYQIGRILCYTILGISAGVLGEKVTHYFQNPYFKAIPAIFMGLILIFIGLRAYFKSSQGKDKNHAWNKVVQKLYSFGFNQKSTHIQSFLLGLFSGLLPCGLLYGVLISLTAFQSPLWGGIGMASFALGTVPILAFGPSFIFKFIKPLKNRWERGTSLSLISIGLITIIFRVVVAYEQCH